MKQKVLISKWIITIITILIFMWSIFSLIEYLNERNEKQRNTFINECIEEMKRIECSEVEKDSACSCLHDYLFNKYGNKIYNKLFIMPTKEDSLDVIDCILNVLKTENVDRENVLKEMSK